MLREFVPVVFAGGEGAPLIPLTNGKPKCLLPVGNLPLIYFTLNYIEREGFSDVYIVTREGWKEDIENELANVNSCFERLALTLKIYYITFNDVDFAGTAQVLNLIKDNINNTRNVIFFGGDFVGNLDSLNELVSLHRKNDSKLSVYLTNAIPLNINHESNGVLATKKKSSVDYQLLRCGQLYINPKDIVLTDVNTEKLLYLLNENEIDDNVVFDPMMMFTFPSISCSTSLHDLHIYIIRLDVLEEISKLSWDQKVESLRVDLIPKVISNQYFGENYENSTSSGYTTDEDKTLIYNPLNDVDVPKSYNFTQVLDYINFGSKNTLNSAGGSFGKLVDQSKISYGQCTVYVNRSTTSVYRVNTMLAFLRANIEICDGMHFIQKPLPPMKPGTRPKKSFARNEKNPKCCIDASSTFAENCDIRRSNVGPNCVIKDGTTLIESTIFNNVDIGKNCVLEHCVVANGSTIEENCILKNCIVGPGECISANCCYENEKIVGATEIIID